MKAGPPLVAIPVGRLEISCIIAWPLSVVEEKCENFNANGFTRIFLPIPLAIRFDSIQGTEDPSDWMLQPFSQMDSTS